MVERDPVKIDVAGSSPASPASFYLLAVRRPDGVVVLSRDNPLLRKRSLDQLLELAKAIKAKPLYAVRVKLRGDALFRPYLGSDLGPVRKAVA